MTPRGVSLRTVASVGAATFIVGAVLARMRALSGALVPAPALLGGVLLVLLVVFVLRLAWPVRSYLRGKATRPLDPHRAARAVMFAQAGALTGGAVVGWYLAELVVVLRSLDLPIYQTRAWQLALCVAAAAALAAAGLLAQSWCRVDPPSANHDHSSS